MLVLDCQIQLASNTRTQVTLGYVNTGIARLNIPNSDSPLIAIGINLPIRHGINAGLSPRDRRDGRVGRHDSRSFFHMELGENRTICSFGPANNAIKPICGILICGGL